MNRLSLLTLQAIVWESASAGPLPPPGHTNAHHTDSTHVTTVAHTSTSSTAVEGETLVMSYEDGEKKLRHRKPDLICISGFTLNWSTERCEKTDVIDASVGCPNGWDLDDGQCHTSFVEPAVLACAPGFERTDKGCVREYDAPMTMLCPPHYVATAEGCVKEVETEPTWACDEGKANGEICEIVKLTLQMVKCPAGFTRVEDSTKCVRTNEETALLKCPISYELRDKKCHKLLKVPAIKRCPDGQITEDGVCISTSVFPVPRRCPPNTVENGQRCRKMRTQNAAEICPPGTEEADRLCIKQEIQPVSYICPGSGVKPNRDGTCTGKEPPVKQCPGGWQFKDKHECVKRSVVRKVLRCPVGMNLIGDHCAADEYFEPIRECPPGTRRLTDDLCTMESRKEVELVCEPPYTLIEATEDCLFSNTVDPTFECVQGFYDEAKGNCVIAESQPADVSCPIGAVKVRSGSRDVCREITYEKAKPSCPMDFVLKEEKYCRGKAILPGKLTCEEPFTDRDGKCVIIEKRLLEPQCNEGNLKGSSCIVKKKQAPSILCPDTYTYEPGSRMCKKFLWGHPDVDCKGWNYDRKVKECYIYEGTAQWEALVTAEKKEVSDPPVAAPGVHLTTTTTTTRPKESLLPLEVHATTTKAPATVKAKIQPPSQGKENFVPIQTFTGPNAIAQAHQYEALKMAGHAAQPVMAPQISPGSF